MHLLFCSSCPVMCFYMSTCRGYGTKFFLMTLVCYTESIIIPNTFRKAFFNLARQENIRDNIPYKYYRSVCKVANRERRFGIIFCQSQPVQLFQDFLVTDRINDWCGWSFAGTAHSNFNGPSLVLRIRMGINQGGFQLRMAKPL